MDYKQKYKEALERASKYNFNGAKQVVKDLVTYIFPELAESEDERVIKEIISIVKSYRENCITEGNHRFDNCISWLEKQGELIDKLVKYREWLISKTEQWTERKNDKTNSNAGKHCCIGAANALISARAEFEEIFDYESWFEKQGEKKETLCDKCRKEQPSHSCQDITANGRCYIEGMNTSNKVKPKFKVKYANSEYNVLEIKEIAGVTFYGIEDEPNHIDYVKADNCEIINGGYGIKENGCSFPTKPIMFSEQKPAWSVEDMSKVQRICKYLDEAKKYYADITEVRECMNWLKSLRPQNHWKPSERQMRAVIDAWGDLCCRGIQYKDFDTLINDLKKL